jgi:hypothetical protein
VNQAREAGEDILIDFAAAKSIFEASFQSTNGQRISARYQGFDPSKTPVKSDAVDAVAVRLKAWETLVLYNTVLESVMQGKTPAEVEAVTTELLNTMASFPSSEIADLAADLNPAIGLLTAVISLAQREYDRKKALDSITEVGPYISRYFVSLLKQDVVIFYNVRMGLNDIAYAQQLRQTTFLIKRYIAIANTVDKNIDVAKLTYKINSALSDIPTKEDGSGIYEPIAPKYAGSTMSKLENEQLLNLTLQIESSVNQLVAIDEQLLAYQKTISSYMEMIDQVDANLRKLIVKAKLNQSAPPDRTELLNSIIRLKKAYQIYQDTKQ